MKLDVKTMDRAELRLAIDSDTHVYLTEDGVVYDVTNLTSAVDDEAGWVDMYRAGPMVRPGVRLSRPPLARRFGQLEIVIGKPRRPEVVDPPSWLEGEPVPAFWSEDGK